MVRQIGQSAAAELCSKARAQALKDKKVRAKCVRSANEEPNSDEAPRREEEREYDEEFPEDF
jgi:hypothetical protein